MSDTPKPWDLEAIEAEAATLGRTTPRTFGEREVLVAIASSQPALVAEVRRLREALVGLVKINAEDFPVREDGRIRWEAYPVTFEYAKVYRAALVALGKETA